VSRVEAWSAAAVAIAGGLLPALERRWPYNPEQRVLRTGFWIDLVLYGFVQSYALGIVIGRLIGAIDHGTGLSRLHLVSAWPAGWQLVFFLVTHDLYIYLFHRLQHRCRLLWRIHEAHHSVPQVDWLSGVRSHALEILVNQSVEFAPILLLGAAPDVAVLKGTISAVWGMFIHSNLDVRLGVLQYLINGPEMHRWHHADQPEAYGRNFSTKLAVWDWLFRTAYFPDPRLRKAQRFGLRYVRYPERFPVDYAIQQAYAFRRSGFGEPSETAPAPSIRRDGVAAVS